MKGREQSVIIDFSFPVIYFWSFPFCFSTLCGSGLIVLSIQEPGELISWFFSNCAAPDRAGSQQNYKNKLEPVLQL
jgi:hypothetical protein